MITVGLTGGLGSGKSVVALFFKELGAHLIDADCLSHEILKEQAVIKAILEFFKEADIVDTKGQIDRKKLGKVAFAKERNIQFLNQLIHPRVRERIKVLCASIQDKEAVVVVDIPLLYEAGWEEMFDVVVVVTAQEKTQIKRCLVRDQALREADIKARLLYQMPLKQKMERADYIIDNDHSLETTRKQVFEIWNKLIFKEDVV